MRRKLALLLVVPDLDPLWQEEVEELLDTVVGQEGAPRPPQKGHHQPWVGHVSSLQGAQNPEDQLLMQSCLSGHKPGECVTCSRSTSEYQNV